MRAESVVGRKRSTAGQTVDTLRSLGSELLPLASAIHCGTEALQGVSQEAHERGECPRVVFGRADCAAEIPILRLSRAVGMLRLVACLGESAQGLLELHTLRMLTALLHGCASLVLDRRCLAQNLHQSASLLTKPVAGVPGGCFQDLDGPLQRLPTALQQLGAPRGRRPQVGESGYNGVKSVW